MAALPSLLLPWEVRDGQFVGFWNHSWLECRQDATHLLLDAVSRGGPVGVPRSTTPRAPVRGRLFVERAYDAADLERFDADALIAGEVWSRT